MAYKPFLEHKLHIQLCPYNKSIYKQLHPLDNIFHILEPKVEHPLHRVCIEHMHWHNQHWQCHLHRRLLDIFDTFLLNSLICLKKSKIILNYLVVCLAYISARLSLLFIEFEFHQVSDCRVRTCVNLDFCSSILSFGSSNMSFSGFFSSSILVNLSFEG